MPITIPKLNLATCDHLVFKAAFAADYTAEDLAKRMGLCPKIIRAWRACKLNSDQEQLIIEATRIMLTRLMATPPETTVNNGHPQ